VAVFFACDGCGKHADTMERRGIAILREYCENCLVEIDHYLARRDEIHDDVSAQWTRRMAALQKEAREDRPDLKLPDVPSDGPDATGVDPDSHNGAGSSEGQSEEKAAPRPNRRAEERSAIIEEAKRLGYEVPE